MWSLIGKPRAHFPPRSLVLIDSHTDWFVACTPLVPELVQPSSLVLSSLLESRASNWEPTPAAFFAMTETENLSKHFQWI